MDLEAPLEADPRSYRLTSRFPLVSLLLLGLALMVSFFGRPGLVSFLVVVAIVPLIFWPPRQLVGNMLSLHSLALLTIGAYSLAVPIHHSFYNDYDATLLERALQLQVAGIAGYVIGVILFPRPKTRPADIDSSIESDSWGRLARAGWYLAIVGAVAAFVAIALTVGVRVYLDAGYAGRSLLKRQTGPIELGLYYVVIGLTAANIGRLKSDRLRKGRASVAALVVSSLAYVAYVSFLGIRRPTFFLVIALLLSYAVAGKGLTRRSLFIYGTPMLLMFATFAQYRQVLSDQGSDQAIDFVGKNASLEWLDLSGTELGAPFRALMDVVASWEDDGPRYGVTFAEAIPNVLPNSFGFEVESLSEEYTRREFSQSFIAIGGNMGFSPVAESYVNFGVLGVVIYMAGVSFVVSMIEVKATRPNARASSLLWYSIAGPWFAFFVRTDLGSFLKVLTYSPIVGLVALYVIYTILGAIDTGIGGTVRVEPAAGLVGVSSSEHV